MKIERRIYKCARLLALISLISLFTACLPKSPEQPYAPVVETVQATLKPADQKPESKSIALVMKTLTNPFFQEMEKGARQAAKELNVRLIVKTAAQETSIAQQIAIVNELIQTRVDAIVIAPGDSRELIPVLKKAQDAGIVVVNIDNILDADWSKKLDLKDVPYVSVDNEKGAYLSAKVISDQVKMPTKAVILEGIRDAKNAVDRKNGAMRAFAENQNIQIVASETAEWKIDEAYTVISKLFEQHPDIGAVFCANDMMALGVLKYVEEKKLTSVIVAGYDDLEQVQPYIQNGELVATIDQQAARQGYTGVLYAHKLLNKENVPPVTLIDVLLVTKDNKK
jgi:ribose transport system substrate-binding protein